MSQPARDQETWRPEPARFAIRPYATTDRQAVRAVCWETAYLGQRIDFLYADRESWADLFTSYYTDQEPESCWVVTNAEGRVVGYLLGCADTRRASSEWLVAMRHHLTRFLWARPGTARFWWQVAWDRLVDRRETPPIDLVRYPAHAHIDLLSEARASGLGQALFETWHSRLRELGARGTHCQVLANNARVIGLLSRLGYELQGEPFILPGMRTPTGERTYGRLIVRSLSP
jgi:ribosomal protein S18 acetylase RimI-like enzyme